MSNNSSPLVFFPSQEWDGNDGSWSTFIIRVGTPAQTFRILPSTVGQETWVPVPEGCLASEPQNCGDLRGVYSFKGQEAGFQYNQSSSWKLIGLYNLVLENNLDYNGNGMYGFDTVGTMIDRGVELENQVVAGIATKDFFLGVLGLGPKPSNFSDFTDPQPSFMRTLKEQNRIPSLCYAYTAGAPYKMPKALGSLTLGGYDQSRFNATTNVVSFAFSSDDSRVLSVGIQSITAMNTISGTITLSNSSAPIYALIDSTVPHIWLPRSVCDRFEESFGLSYDANTDLYLFNNSATHDQLIGNNPSIVINLGNDNDPAGSVQVTLPFAAFDLQASWPIYANATPYFPIRRAANDTQYTLGRVFLQEAYIIADYERANFSVHQALFPPSNSDIVTIHPPGSMENNSTQGVSSRNLKAGAIAGIVVGAALGISLLAALGIYLWRRGRCKRKPALETEQLNSIEGLGNPLHEMAHAANESKGGNIPVELDSTGVFLMSDDARRIELASMRV